MSAQVDRRSPTGGLAAFVLVMSAMTASVATLGWIGWNFLVRYEALWIKVAAVSAPLISAVAAAVVASYLMRPMRRGRADRRRPDPRVAPKRSTFVAIDEARA